MRTQLTWLAEDQRLHPDDCCHGQHMVKQLGIGDRHHDSCLAEPVRIHVGILLRSALGAPRQTKSVDDASSGFQPVNNTIRPGTVAPKVFGLPPVLVRVMRNARRTGLRFGRLHGYGGKRCRGKPS